MRDDQMTIEYAVRHLETGGGGRIKRTDWGWPS